VPDLSHVSRGCSDYLSNGQRWAGTLVALRARLEADPFVVSAIGLGFNGSTQQFVDIAQPVFRNLASCVAVR